METGAFSGCNDESERGKKKGKRVSVSQGRGRASKGSWEPFMKIRRKRQDTRSGELKPEGMKRGERRLGQSAS